MGDTSREQRELALANSDVERLRSEVYRLEQQIETLAWMSSYEFSNWKLNRKVI